VTGNVAGTVTGEILGLVDNAASSATDIIITSAPAGLTGGLPTIPFSIDDYAASLGEPIDPPLARLHPCGCRIPQSR
jgi:hypothetical protein